MELRDFIRLSGFSRDSPIYRSTVANAMDGDRDDIDSRVVFLTRISSNPEIFAEQKFAQLMGDRFDLKLTSFFRESLTHRHGAIDLAPNIAGPMGQYYAHNRSIDPRLYARKELLRAILDVVSEMGSHGQYIQVLVEDNHIHVHPMSVGIKVAGLPAARLLIQHNGRAGYARSMNDIESDEFIFQQAAWKPMDYDDINQLPPFQARFQVKTEQQD